VTPVNTGAPATAEGVCCATLVNEALVRQKFCRNCDWPDVKTQGECTNRVTDKYLGCFRRAEDSLVFQTCHGVAEGSSCMYETGASSRRNTPAYNTTGVCLRHIYHQGVMCLEAIGDEDDEECNGKAVGQPCTHSESPNAICTHDPRRGTWMCAAPKTEAPVIAVCEGMEKGTPCSYTAKIDPRFDNGMDSGLIQGACDLYDETHTDMMCLAATGVPDDKEEDEVSTEGVPGDKEEKVQALKEKDRIIEEKEQALKEKEEGDGSPDILIIAFAAASLLVGCIAGVCGGRIVERRMQQKKPATVSQPGGDFSSAAVGRTSPDQKGEEVPSEPSSCSRGATPEV